MHLYLRHLAASLIAAFAFVSTAVFAQDAHPLVGTWTGTWKSGLIVELTVTAVEDRKAHGMYCNVRPDRTIWFTDLHPEHGVDASVNRKGRLKYGFNKTKWEFKPGRSDPDTMQMVWRRGGKKRTLDVNRVDGASSPCHGRVATRDEAPRTEFAPSDHSYVGTWAAEWAGNGGTTEVTFHRIDGDTVYGTYCHRDSRGFFVYDLYPGSSTPATVRDDGSVHFQDTASPPATWTFEAAGDRLAFHFVNRRGREFDIELNRTVEPACLARVVPIGI